VPDPELVAYVEAIERRLTCHRGKEHALNPPDFELARRWFRAGVSLATVLAAIDAAETAGETLFSLAPLKKRIESRPSRAGGRPGS
jgi:hypothetical protein